MTQEAFITSPDGTAIFSEVSGSGPITLVLCDGLGCAGFIWKHLQPAFEDRCRMLHWHYRGHGLSGTPPEPDALGINALVADLKAVLDAHDVERAVLSGHSMGVQLILEFAWRYPDRVLGLLPMCGSYGRPLDTFHNTSVLGALFPYVREAVMNRPDRAQWLWSKTLGSELAYQFALRTEVNRSVIRRADFLPYLKHMGAMDFGVFVRMLDQVKDHTVEEHLNEIQAPTLVVAGEHDSFTPAWLSRRMVRLMPEAELLVVPGGTHVAPLEIPELVHLRIQRFFDERVLTASSERHLGTLLPSPQLTRPESPPVTADAIDSESTASADSGASVAARRSSPPPRRRRGTKRVPTTGARKPARKRKSAAVRKPVAKHRPKPID